MRSLGSALRGRGRRDRRMFVRITGALAWLALGLASGSPAAAQAPAAVSDTPPSAVRPVAVQRITIHSRAIEGNLEGNSADRAVLVMLPPGYERGRRRYPVLYALHGYSTGVEQWSKALDAPRAIAAAFAAGTPPMIVVMPDSRTLHDGSMYSGSQTVGDFETFVARDLVAFVDAHYRTLPARESRGLAGHSMGGYGTARIGMKHPDVFGALYMMSPCCMAPRDPATIDLADEATLGAVRGPADLAKLSWVQRAQLATAAAFSPNPRNAPLYLDLPMKNGKLRPDVLARWTANSPLAFLDQYIGNLRRYRAIGLDVGNADPLPGLLADARTLHDRLQAYGIAHDFAIYDGDHGSHVPLRFREIVLPFFGRHLRGAQP